jgi:hypothetical protein
MDARVLAGAHRSQPPRCVGWVLEVAEDQRVDRVR